MENTKKIQLESDVHHYHEPIFKIFRVHPNGVKIEKAEKTLKGAANQAALTWCGPYGDANAYGWWVYPGFDLDITCHEHPVENCYHGRWGGYYTYSVNSYDNSDYELMGDFDREIKNNFNIKYMGKQHYAIDEPEKNCISLWTGCVLQMPKDWSLMIKSPTNIGLVYGEGSPVCVQEGILEVDWMRYDIWMNFKFHTYEKKLSFRKNQTWPIAQLIPVHKSSYTTNWKTSEKLMDSSDQECIDMYESYSEYNYKKWYLQGEKDPFVFRKLKKEESKKYPSRDLFCDANPEKDT